MARLYRGSLQLPRPSNRVDRERQEARAPRDMEYVKIVFVKFSQLLTCPPGIFEDRPAEFSSMFRRVLSMLLDRTLPMTVRTHLLCFLIYAFQSLDCDIVRKECAPLVSIGIWHNLSSDKLRESQIDQMPHLRKAWRAAHKRYDAADDATKARLRFERSWLYSLFLDFLSMLYEPAAKPGML